LWDTIAVIAKPWSPGFYLSGIKIIDFRYFFLQEEPKWRSWQLGKVLLDKRSEEGHENENFPSLLALLLRMKKKQT
jgi:hypothetical protein